MSTLTDLITEALLHHQRIPTLAGPNRNQCTGCDHLQNETDGANSPRVEAHRADVAAAVVADWLESDETTFALQVEGPRSMEQVRAALAAEARKGADQ